MVVKDYCTQGKATIVALLYSYRTYYGYDYEYNKPNYQ
jgi:hypothetical protein